MKQIKIISVFVLILIGVLYGLQQGLRSLYMSRSNDKVTALEKHQLDYNIMIFGSSVAYHDLNPDILNQTTGYSTFNMGLDGTFIIQYKALIKEYISYTKQTKCIVIGCDFDNLGRNGLITRPDFYHAYLSNKYVMEALSEIEPSLLKSKYIPGYDLTLYNRRFYSSIFLHSVNPEIKGFLPVAPTPFVSLNIKAFKGLYDSAVYKSVRDLVQEIAHKGIKVVLLMTPINKDGYKFLQNAEEIKDKYRALVGENIYFVDHSTDTEFVNTKTYFYNFSHLNTTGADLFSKEFGAELAGIINEKK